MTDPRLLDTHLARLLVESGRLELSVVLPLLEEARRGRRPGGSGVSLAQLAVQRGLLPEAEAASLLTHLAPDARPLAEAWAPGGRIDTYLLEDRLGAGGMGVVFAARHLTTNARYALKVLSSAADPDLLARFQREGEAQASVSGHPNVAGIHGAGSAHGRHYLVLDYVSGGDLQARLDRGPIAQEEALRIVSGVAAGLAFVHARGVLHRDLKPHNVLFHEDGRPLLVDFGLAKVESAESLTHTGEILGTPAYMAPEQVLGAPVDPRTDVYGLGAILYACLTGQPPYTGSGLGILALVVEGKFPRVRSLAPETSPRLASLCERALHLDPDERFQSVAEFQRAQDEALNRPEVTAWTPSLAFSLIALVLLAILAQASLGLFGGSGLFASHTPSPVAASPTAIAKPEASPTQRRSSETRAFSKRRPGARRAFFVDDDHLAVYWFRDNPPRGTIELWRVSRGDRRIEQVLERGFPCAFSKAAFAVHQGSLYFVAPGEHMLQRVDLGTLRPTVVGELGPKTHGIYFGRDGLLATRSDRKVTLRGKGTRPLPPLDDAVRKVALCGTGAHLVAILSRRKGRHGCYVYALEGGREWVFVKLRTEATCLAPIKGQSRVLIGSKGGDIHEVDCSSLEVLRTLSRVPAESLSIAEARIIQATVRDLVATPERIHLVSDARVKTNFLRHWDLRTGQFLKEELPLPGGENYNAIDLSPDGKALAITIRDKEVLVRVLAD